MSRYHIAASYGAKAGHADFDQPSSTRTHQRPPRRAESDQQEEGKSEPARALVKTKMKDFCLRYPALRPLRRPCASGPWWHDCEVSVHS